MSKKRHNKTISEELNADSSDAVDANVQVKEDTTEQEEKVDFDSWFVMRGSQIPKHHHKEIIKADFMGRGLRQHESLQVFDAALNKYGIKLK